MKDIFQLKSLAVLLITTNLVAGSTTHNGLYQQNIEEQESRALAKIALEVPTIVEMEIKPVGKKLLKDLAKTEKIRLLVQSDPKYRVCRNLLIDTAYNNAQLDLAKELLDSGELEKKRYNLTLKRLHDKNRANSTNLAQCKKQYKGLI